MKQSEKEQAYVIAKIFGYMKNTPPSLTKDDVRYWKLQNKMIRNFEIGDKNYIQLLSEDEETVFVSFCEDGNMIKFFKNNIGIESLDKIIL